MAVSRLDRLFILLDTGTTPVTRKAAAQQLGEVVKLHPHELNNLVSKVLTYLRSPNWDTRIAAGQAVEAIVKNIPVWDPTPKLKEEPSEGLSPEDSSCDRLTFYHFDISRLLQHGASLLGSAGAEFELQDDKTAVLTEADVRSYSLCEPIQTVRSSPETIPVCSPSTAEDPLAPHWTSS
uniref:B-TFIID TATA-box binding protein associated factor 1 n=1 Tax=Gasterosteus aculeatus aculeatus TaxID=481459 RepID=A0AAQ4NPQ0_GASAC